MWAFYIVKNQQKQGVPLSKCQLFSYLEISFLFYKLTVIWHLSTTAEGTITDNFTEYRFINPNYPLIAEREMFFYNYLRKGVTSLGPVLKRKKELNVKKLYIYSKTLQSFYTVLLSSPCFSLMMTSHGNKTTIYFSFVYKVVEATWALLPTFANSYLLGQRVFQNDLFFVNWAVLQSPWFTTTDVCFLWTDQILELVFPPWLWGKWILQSQAGGGNLHLFLVQASSSPPLASTDWWDVGAVVDLVCL